MDPRHQRGSIGPIVGLVIILGIILAGGIYFYTTIKTGSEYDRQNAQTPATTPTENTPAQPDTLTRFSTQSTSSDPTDIQNDLNAVDANSVTNVGTDL